AWARRWEGGGGGQAGLGAHVEGFRTRGGAHGDRCAGELPAGRRHRDDSRRTPPVRPGTRATDSGLSRDRRIGGPPPLPQTPPPLIWGAPPPPPDPPTVVRLRAGTAGGPPPAPPRRRRGGPAGLRADGRRP